MTKARLMLLTAVLAIAPLAASATPVVYTIADGGLDGEAGCSGTVGACPNLTGSNHKFQYDPPAAPPNAFDAASGTITLDSMAATVTIDIDVASATFLSVGGPDNGVDEIEFTSLNYSATITSVSFTPDGFGNTTIGWVAQTPGITSVTGSYEQLLVGGNVNGPDVFAVTARVSAGLCTLDGSNNLVCGFVLGPGGFTLPVGPDGFTLDRRFVHTLNVVAIPEPGTAVLVGLGIVGVAMRGRSR